MLIAQQLQEKSRAEYLLYMWQVEDIIRLHHADLDALKRDYLSQFQLPLEQMKATEDWYGHLCAMLREEGKLEKGHLQINQNVIAGLTDLHDQLLASNKFPYYRQMYYKVLPYVVELRAKEAHDQATPPENELERCFELLYGVMLLRLQRKEISEGTQQATTEVSAFLGQLSDYWKKERAGELTFD